ncbi:isocitrate lyase/phosphoenolpyruvate mutase family protein [Streptomyces acidiscabies]|uniref:Isocitrate lyase/phosphoenolpyruvate mutase family protein n=1 Tax=Streptomyces acidiscabies TaxID=42234 RepID=A0AAP6BDD9_9ACTN|nr:isocitrate lyase/phosphoenolpyruvate mutase family protein [Streptomyces acidiscabies]MBZ3917628.1 isocitrate lyase/phosphoenolpyruvate mutase family protein [Streptomyces acidiscabies]MDX2962685.1 isocitrate lyase/phosphoenolpyruvate mutase family protein [Streptomyces acidiscabies]MDX3019008.1 isocitrate lyase/phosphoenolpyruvate mutase family protein [Streptomyces acidiscabies]MDX3790320.1 isocitrate lyase/phosphoenolpyruvate mutase family protein [Streptomyces acidiscabies]GAQ52723.1 ph
MSLKPPSAPSFRSLLRPGRALRVAGAHSALGAVLAEQEGFDAIWSSSLEISASRCLPDASILTMTEYLEAAAHMQKALGIPVVADADTGYGNNLNVAHMVHEFEDRGITAVAIEDKLFPKINSFADGDQTLLSTEAFVAKIETAKKAQRDDEFFVIARTEALINGLGVDVALDRAHAYADGGADAVLIHSKKSTNTEVVEFVKRWEGRLPVVVVPTTYPDWNIAEAEAMGVQVVIYANQGMRATISSLRETYRSIRDAGDTVALEPKIASVADIFRLQRLKEWQQLGA